MPTKPITFLAFLWLLCIGSSLTSGCQPEPLRLKSQHRKTVDTLARAQTALIRVELDSLCNLHFDQEVARARDSIFTVRFNDFKEKLGK